MKAKWSTFFIVMIFGLSACLNDGGDPNAALNAEIKQIDEYLAVNFPGANNILYDNARGMRFVIHAYGDDAPPSTGQRVTINYQGELFADETPFAAGALENDFEDISPPGLQAALGAMLEGTEATIFIPSKYGYGETGTTTVPPNSILVYHVYLSNVERTNPQKAQLASDIAAIDTYLETAEITAEEHSSGIRYTIDTPGSGSFPTSYSAVDFEYELRQLTASGLGETIVDQGTLTNYNIFGLIDGLKIGMPRLMEGTSATFYIPSTLGYGTTGMQGGVPANANLVFKIKLLDVK